MRQVYFLCIAVVTAAAANGAIQIRNFTGGAEAHLLEKNKDVINTLKIRPGRADYERHVKEKKDGSRVVEHSSGSFQVSTGDAAVDEETVEKFVNGIQFDIPNMIEEAKVM